MHVTWCSLLQPFLPPCALHMGGGEGVDEGCRPYGGLWSSQCGTSNSIKGIIYVPLPITEQHGDS